MTNTNNLGYLAQSIHYHSVGMVIALELLTVVLKSVFVESQNLKLKSLIMAQIERWRQA